MVPRVEKWNKNKQGKEGGENIEPSNSSNFEFIP